MQFILDSSEKALRRFTRNIVVDGSRVDIGDFLVEYALGKPYSPDPL